MSIVTLEPRPLVPEPPPPQRGILNYLNVRYGVSSWLLTIDHKRIAILYLVSVSIMFMLGGFFAMLIRLELLTPRGDLLGGADAYNRSFTLHGVIMVFFFLIPSIPAVFGNFLVPLMIGAKDLAFPKINLISWYLYIIGGLLAVYVLLSGGVDTGWTFYTPYSTRGSHYYVMGAAVAAFIAGFSSILTGLNFVVTIHYMRAPGMTWGRLPLFIWAMYATSLVPLWVWASSIRAWAGTRSSSSTCSGSTPIRRSTS
jgi:cytochrome c oxidase subunit I